MALVGLILADWMSKALADGMAEVVQPIEFEQGQSLQAHKDKDESRTWHIEAARGSFRKVIADLMVTLDKFIGAIGMPNTFTSVLPPADRSRLAQTIFSLHWDCSPSCPDHECSTCLHHRFVWQRCCRTM